MSPHRKRPSRFFPVQSSKAGICDGVCVSAHDMTFRDVPAYFSKTHSVRVTTAWLRSKRVWVLDWSDCSPDLRPIGDAWRIMKRKI